VKNATGLHARPAADFVAIAAKYDSNITLKRVDDEDLYNAKSIVMLLALGLENGEDAILSAEGADERDAVEALSDLIDSFTE
jgi:phosphocarrier protein